MAAPFCETLPGPGQQGAGATAGQATVPQIGATMRALLTGLFARRARGAGTRPAAAAGLAGWQRPTGEEHAAPAARRAVSVRLRTCRCAGLG